jgi:hypothetical protein
LVIHMRQTTSWQMDGGVALLAVETELVSEVPAHLLFISGFCTPAETGHAAEHLSTKDN